MISKERFFILVVMLLIPTGINAQYVANRQNGIRCGYHFHKKYTPKSSYTKFLNMRLDYYDGEAMFYDEFTFERDSLKLLAFDENGKTQNQEEYNKMQSLPRPRLDDVTLGTDGRGKHSRTLRLQESHRPLFGADVDRMVYRRCPITHRSLDVVGHSGTGCFSRR